MTVNERIKILAETEKLNQSAFATKAGITKQTVSSIFGNKYAPKADTISQICQAFPLLSVDWLVTGRGEMWKDQKNDSNSVTQSGKRNEQRVNIGSQTNDPAASYGKGELEARIMLLERLCKQKDEALAEKERYIQLLEKSRQ